MADPNAPATRPRRAPAASQSQAEAPIRKATGPATGPTVYQLIGELKDWFHNMARSFASFSALNGALTTARGQKAADGERVRGMPIFEFKATVDGTDSIGCALDLAKVRPEYQEHVLIPLAEMTAQELLESIEEIEERIALIKPQLIAMTGANQAQQQ